MKYEIKKQNLFNSGAQVIVHQVNCMGVMGSGVAKQVKNLYPNVFLEYCKAVRTLERKCLGGCLVVEAYPGLRIANLFGQYYYRGYKEDYTFDLPYEQPELTESCEAIRFTNYEAFYRGLVRLKNELRENEKRIAFPYNIGCDRGGASWPIIENMIKCVFSDLDVEIIVCQI